MTETPLARFLPPEAIANGVHAAGRDAAVRAAGELLVSTGACTEQYVDLMRAAADEYGRHLVIAPGLALAHTRPCAAVLRTGLAWVSLAVPVVFGHPQHDPVDVVIGLAATSDDAHSGLLSKLARMLSEADRLRELRSASDPAQLHALVCARPQERAEL